MEREPSTFSTEETEQQEPDSDPKERIFETVSRENPSLPNMSLAEAELFQTTIPQLPEYQQYLEQDIRLDTIESIVQDFDSQTKGRENDQSVQTIRNYLLQTNKGLRKSLGDYHRARLNFEHVNESPVISSRVDPENHRRLKENAGLSRRNYHNGIITLLGNLRRNCLEKLPQEFNVHIPEEKLFSEELLKDEKRDIIGDWAYNTEVGERLKGLLTQAKEVIEQNKKGERA